MTEKSIAEIVNWIAGNPRHVIFCMPGQSLNVCPKGVSFSPYTRYDSPYQLNPTRDENYFSITKTGCRSWQPSKTYPMQKWEKMIRKKAELGAIPGFILEKIVSEMG